ncbi:MAG: PEP-CTERM sorting domain-containing protein [Cyanobacteriota bacterium]|nr:PEP-CTERM sorting domain-containing protein [Cyanobacteriota bacterium]
MFSSTFIRFSALTTGFIGSLCLFGLGSNAKAATVVNGGFNSDLSGWTVVNQPGSFGSWFQTAGGTSVLGFNPILAPSEGTGYAHSAQTGSTSQVLFQDITLEAGFDHVLSFDWFAQNWARIFADAGTLNRNVRPNQHFRVDLVSTGFTDWFGPNSSAGVLANILAPVAEPAPVSAWNDLSFDLTPWAGQTVRLAFRQVDNQFFFNAAVDDVKIASTPSTIVPEPSSMVGLLALGALGAGSVLKRKQHHS